MVVPIRFEKSGPVPRFKVQRLRDLEDVKDQIDYEIKQKISLLDDLTKDQDENDPQDSYFEENTKNLRALHSRMAKMMSVFETMVSNCEISESLQGEERTSVKEKISALQAHSESLKQIASKKVALTHAKILTKTFWKELPKLQSPVDDGNRDQIELFFKNCTFTKAANRFQKVLYEINQSLESTKGLTGTELYTAIIRKGELLEAKEELITVFIEYKKLASLRYSEISDKKTPTSFLSPRLVKKFEDDIKGLKGSPDFIDKVHSTISSNRYSDPTSLIKDSISLAMLKTSPSNIHAIHNLSASSATLSLGFALPVSFLNTVQLIRNRARRRKLMLGIHESRDIQAMGDLMYREGQNVRRMAQSMLAEKIEDESELEKLGLLLKQASRLMTLGIELKEKAHLTEQELQKEVNEITFTLFNSAISTPLGLAGLAATSLKIASDFMKSPAISAGLQAMHFVGIASGSIGLFLGTVGLIKKSQKISSVRSKLKELDKKRQMLTSLEEEHKDDPLISTFCNMEKSKLLAEKQELTTTLRNLWIELANSILLTIGGAIAFAAVFTSAGMTGGMSIAVFAIISVSTVIVFAHWAKKKDWQQEKIPISTKFLQEIGGNFDPIGHYLRLEKEKLERYRDSPITFLNQHFA